MFAHRFAQHIQKKKVRKLVLKKKKKTQYCIIGIALNICDIIKLFFFFLYIWY